MDNLTHSLVGAALALTPLGRLHAKSTLLLIIAANLPDLDVVTALGGKQAHFVHHRGITHSIVGVVAQAVLMACVVKTWEAWRARRGGAQASRWRNLLLLCGIGLFSHPLLDYLNTYGVRPWLPFDSTWYYGDLVFIVDPWLWLILGGVLATASARTRTSNCWLAVAALLASVAIYWTDRPPLYFRVLWPFFLGLLALLRYSRIGAKRPAIPLVVAALVATVYLDELDGYGDYAERYGSTAVEWELPVGEKTLQVVRSPELLDPKAWTILVETDRAVYRRGVHVNAISDPIVRLDKHIDERDVQLALANPCTAGWRTFARLPIAATQPVDGVGTLVRLGDARYQSSAESSAWCSTEVLIRPDSSVLCLEEQPAPLPVPPVGSSR